MWTERKVSVLSRGLRMGTPACKGHQIDPWLSAHGGWGWARGSRMIPSLLCTSQERQGGPEGKEEGAGSVGESSPGALWGL